MHFYRRICGGFAILFIVMLLAACGALGGSNAPQAQTKATPTLPPTPTPGPGQQLLSTMAQKFNTASTLHGVFDVKITGPAFSGTENSEIWNALPNKIRTVVLQSTVAQFPTGSITVSDGKVIWLYDPTKKIVYKGPVTVSTASATPTANGQQGGRNQLILNILRPVFTQSDATLVSSSTKINGHDAYDVHVVSRGQSATSGGGGGGGFGNFSYSGNVYIDKTTNLPIQVNLMIQGLGQVLLNIPMLILNQPIPASTFTFVVPEGVKVLSLPPANTIPGTGSLTLDQAQQRARQAGYHLLSIPASQADYVLGNVNALGAPGNQIYTLSYTKGSSSFTIAQGKALANLPSSGGRQVSLRGTTGTVSTTNGATTLSWTEKGVGITITGNGLTGDQLLSIANLLL